MVPRVYHTRVRTTLLRGLVGVGLTTGLLLMGCGRALTVQTRTYEPGQVAAQRDALSVELVSATYDERELTVTIAFENAGATAASVQRHGLLLSYEQLEFPARQTTAARTVELEPGARQQVTLRFDMGTALLDDAELKVRGARRGQQWLDVLSLTIPKAPDVVAVQ